MRAVVVAAILAAGCGAPPIEPRLSVIEQQIFKVSCSLGSCHGSAREGNLSLTGPGCWGDLVNAPADGPDTRDKGLIRVVPGDPEASLLYRKITHPRPGEGAPMPDLAGARLSDEQIEAIREWIARGAPND